ncbi:hypothetical protein RHGRI_032541 [Rhododendron griersonianum]|uniref:Uncharacterized protein n=1 Tax=Rhododendron griersonianum TaxID=479676 RepID=A0AAV6ICC8_9ERIC|nr:hypothetical protein RHGRI_032541 [Rhododendron griersonianum]
MLYSQAPHLLLLLPGHEHGHGHIPMSMLRHMSVSVLVPVPLLVPVPASASTSSPASASTSSPAPAPAPASVSVSVSIFVSSTSSISYTHLSAAITLGFEHHVVMLGTTVIIPSIIVHLMGGGQKEKAEVIQTSLFVAGLNTPLQTWFGTRLPVVIGSSYSFIAPALFIGLSDRYSKYVDPLERFEKSMRGIQGAMMIAFIIPILLGFFALLTASGAYRNKSSSTQVSCHDQSGLISGAAWISFPYPWQWGTPSVDAGDVFVMIAAALVALIEGIGWLLDGLFGTASGSTVSPENAGFSALTRSGSRSRRVVQISAGFMLFFGVLGKFGAILASIPLPIFAALQCISLAYETSDGLELLHLCDLDKLRTKFIVGFSIFMGLSVPQYFNGYMGTSGCGPVHTHANWFDKFVEIIFTSPATVAAMIAVFLDCTVPPGRTDNGKIETDIDWVDMFQEYFTNDLEVDPEYFSLPLGLSDCFPISV